MKISVVFRSQLANDFGRAPHLAVTQGSQFLLETHAIIGLRVGINADLCLVATLYAGIQFLYHGLIVAYGIARFASGEIPLVYADLWGSVAKILILVAVMYVIDTVFKKNYMFLRDYYGNPMLGVIWKVCKGGFAYTCGLTVFSIFMIHVFFALFKCIELLMLR